MLDDDLEWIELYRYLLQELRRVEANSSLILDIERAAAARIEEDISENNEVLTVVSKESREDLDSIRLRTPTPRESFTAAIGVLVSRLREVPALADRLAEQFSYTTSNIQWSPDISERDRLSDEGFFSIESFSMSREEAAEVESALDQLDEIKNQLESQE